MLSFFDCNVCLGKRGPKHPLEMWKTEDILAEMERCGISAALCYAGPAKDYSPRYGNEWLYEELKKSPKLYGCYTVCPNQAGEFMEPSEMIADMRAKDMRAATVCTPCWMMPIIPPISPMWKSWLRNIPMSASSWTTQAGISQPPSATPQ